MNYEIIEDDIEPFRVEKNNKEKDSLLNKNVEK